MLPTYKAGQTVLATRILFTLKPNDIIILHSPLEDRLIIKRIKEINNNKYFVVGDNEKESTDSRHFGWVKRKHIRARVLFKLE